MFEHLGDLGRGLSAGLISIRPDVDGRAVKYAEVGFVDGLAAAGPGGDEELFASQPLGRFPGLLAFND